MTSRPAVGAHPPIQRNASGGIQRPPAQRARSTAQNQVPTNARPPGSVIDLTADTDAKPPAGGGWSQQMSNDPTRAPNAQAKFARPALPNLKLNDGSMIGYDPESLNDSDGKQSATPSPKPTIPSLPFPPRPPGRRPEKTLPTGDVKQKPERKPEKTGSGYALEKPDDAAHYPDGRLIDFYPWTGNGPEDNLSVHAVEKGFLEQTLKANELGTARPSLWPHIKNKSGLSMLSSLFVQALEKRQTLGRVTTPSQYKLPPRIAQNDKRREMWIKELADPNVPLRKLSTRIPHAIKGTVLLEQCLNKGVPTARAVWLAKCVGALEMAHEMRARQRTTGGNSGANMGGEAKWVREWTVQVEQFVHNTIKACGQPDWKKKIDYVIRFASHLFTERLLDRAYFLNWILKSLAKCTVDELPIWLVLVQIYWKHLVSNRKRGCRLAEALLAQFSAVASQPKATNGPLRPLIDRLRQLICTLILSHQDCLIIPKTWTQYKDVLASITSTAADENIAAVTSEISKRNDRLTAAGRKRSEHTPRARLIGHLDSLGLNIHIKALTSTCLDIMPVPEDALSTILQWATSAYREGSHRVYIATRLIRKWQADGMDTDEVLMLFLNGLDPSCEMVDPMQVKRLLAELVSQNQFSVGRYLRWLISTGAMMDDIAGMGRLSHASIVAELPVFDLPAHVANLRETLLDGMGADLHEEDHMIVAAKALIQRQLPGLLKSSKGPIVRQDSIQIKNLTIPVQRELTRWLREAVWCHNATVGRLPTSEDQCTTEEACVLTAREFYVVRHILEETQDFPVFADILKTLTTSADSTVLAAVADTANFHSHTFAAIGAVKSICEDLISRYLELRLQRPPDRILVSSLLALTNLVLKDQPRTVGQLKYDLSRCDQRTAVAMCSPASDNMADMRDASSLTPDEEIERILVSGNSMDEQNMRRVFGRICSRTTQALNSKDKPLSHERLRSWFYRLRAFEPSAFDRLLAAWMMNILGKADCRSVNVLMPALLTGGCISMSSVWNWLESMMNAPNTKLSPQILLEVVLPTGSPSVSVLAHDDYRYLLERRALCTQKKHTVIRAIRQALELCSSPADKEKLSMLCARQEWVLTLLKEFLVEDTAGLCSGLKLEDPQLNQHGLGVLQELLSALAGVTPGSSNDGPPTQGEMRRCIALADELSLPFCQIKLRFMQATWDQAAQDIEAEANGAIVEAIKDAIENGRHIWVDLLGGLNADVAQQICQHAENGLLNSTLDIQPGPAAPLLERYLAIIDATASKLPETGRAAAASMLVEKLKGILETLSTIPSSTGQSNQLGCQNLTPWLDAYLHLSLVHRDALLATKLSALERTTFILVFCNLFINPELQQCTSTMAYLYDVLAWFSDDLTEDVFTHLSILLSRQPSLDRRLSFIFGITPTPDCWLGIVASATQPTISNLTPSLRPPPLKPGQTMPQRPQQGQRAASGFWSSQNLSQSQKTSVPEIKETKPIPFPLRRWEVLPEAGGTNDTALGLTLFGARKVL